MLNYSITSFANDNFFNKEYFKLTGYSIEFEGHDSYHYFNKENNNRIIISKYSVSNSVKRNFDLIYDLYVFRNGNYIIKKGNYKKNIKYYFICNKGKNSFNFIFIGRGLYIRIISNNIKELKNAIKNMLKFIPKVNLKDTFITNVDNKSKMFIFKKEGKVEYCFPDSKICFFENFDRMNFYFSNIKKQIGKVKYNNKCFIYYNKVNNSFLDLYLSCSDSYVKNFNIYGIKKFKNNNFIIRLGIKNKLNTIINYQNNEIKKILEKNFSNDMNEILNIK